MQLQVGDVIKDSLSPNLYRVREVVADANCGVSRVKLTAVQSGVQLHQLYSVDTLAMLGFQLHLGGCLLEDESCASP